MFQKDGELIDNYSKTLVKETVTDKTSDFIKEALRAVVTDGTGKTAAIPGYTIGGKTGTAEKHYTDGKTGRIPGEYIVSFLGCAPVENPEGSMLYNHGFSKRGYTVHSV